MKSGKPGTGLHCVIVLSQYYKTAVLHAMLQSIVVIDRPMQVEYNVQNLKLFRIYVYYSKAQQYMCRA